MTNQRNAPANITLHIERLVLDGGALTGTQLGQLQSSLERELTSLLRAGGLPTHSRTEVATHGHLPLQPSNRTPDQLGRALAQGIYTSLNPVRDVRP